MRNALAVLTPLFLIGAPVSVCADETADAQATAEALWQGGDYQRAAAAIAKMPYDGGRDYSSWKDLFRERGQSRVLLEALVRANPKDRTSRLELLDLESDPLDVRFTGDLEELLEADAGWAFDEGKGGPRNGTRFRDDFDLAYRLMRLYEKQGRIDDLCALGLRIARGDKPFRHWWTWLPCEWSFADNAGRDIDACFALVVQDADSSSLAELEKSLPGQPWLPVRDQLRRRMKQGWPPQVQPALGWANLSDGVSAWVCSDAVLSIAHDDKYIYAGMPWGVAVYSRAGAPITRIALAAAVECIVIQGQSLWAAAREGIFRVTPDTWEAASLPLVAGSPRDRQGGPFARRRDERIVPTALFCLDSVLWIGAAASIQRYDPSTGYLSRYPLAQEGEYPERFLFDGAGLWAVGNTGSARYDKSEDSWKSVTYEENSVRILAYADGILWGETKVNEQLGCRPCIIDRQSLEITPVLIDEAEPYARERRGYGPNAGFTYRGAWEGKPVIGFYYYDKTKAVLRSLPENAHLEGANEVWRRIAAISESPSDTWGTIRSEPETLPDGSIVCGLCPRYETGYPYPTIEGIGEHEVSEHEGGLYLISDGKPPARISSSVFADSLPGDIVTGLVFGSDRRHWVCTVRGLAAFDENEGVFAHLCRSDGLCANRVRGGVSFGNKDFFAVGYGDNNGGLAVYDRKTDVFTTWLQSDGLATGKLAGVERQGDLLELTYDVEYLRFAASTDHRYQKHPRGLFDTRDGTVTSGGPPQAVPEAEAQRWGERAADRKREPFLGGFILSEETHGDKTYRCGTRGLVILSDAVSKPETLAIAAIEPRIVLNSTEAQWNAAQNTRIAIASPDDVTRYFEDPNPYIRARALASIPRTSACVPIDPSTHRHFPISISSAYEAPVIAALSDSDEDVRETALWCLLQMPDTPDGTSALKNRTNDSDLAIRGIAAVELTRRGECLDEDLLRWLLEKKSFHYTLRVAGKSWGNTLASKDDLYTNIAAGADARMFKLLLEFPPSVWNTNLQREVFPALGAALRRHPDAADALLHAKDTGYPEALSRDFAAHVFGIAGKKMLPALGRAITSDDPLVRANAARACGRIDDPASAISLAQGLSFKDRQTSEAIAEALVKSKRTESTPVLVKLFVQSSKESEPLRRKCKEICATMEINNPANDEKRAAVVREREKCLFPDDITRLFGHSTDAEAKAQEFYRLLAAEDDLLGQTQAACKLGEAKGEDVAKNLPVLRTLLDHSQPPVRLTAAVSLVLLGDEAGQKPILESLQTANEADLGQVLTEVRRAKKPGLLSFARQQIETIARNASFKETTRVSALELVQER